MLIISEWGFPFTIENMKFYSVPHHLPDPSLITETAKTAFMESISSKSLCGEADFSYPSLKKVKLLAGENGAICSKRVHMRWLG
jgi:hypothetical protein